MNELENNYNAAGLSADVRDERILSLLQLVEDMLIYPEQSMDIVSTWLDEHPNLDNPDLDVRAGMLRSMVR
jgi:hypothetical protein